MTIGKQLRELGTRLTRWSGWRGSDLEEFQSHLVELHLLGRRFELSDYIVALGAHRNVDIKIADYLDQQNPLLQSMILKEGAFGQVMFCRPDGPVIVAVREGFKYRPWPTYELAVYHELLHWVGEHRDEQSVTEKEYELQENQVIRWANWLVLASSEPELFSREGIETIT